MTDLRRGEDGYLDALRAYTDSLYAQLMELAPPGKRFFLDRTPAYALVLPFLTRLYPAAKYVVLTRHPLAVLSSYAESFFDGDYTVAVTHNPVLERYVPALAALLRTPPVPPVWVKYEALAREPEAEFRRVCDHLGIPFEEGAMAYGDSGEEFKGLGTRRACSAIRAPSRRRSAPGRPRSRRTRRSSPSPRRCSTSSTRADLETLGYPREEIVADLTSARRAPVPVKAKGPWRYRMEQKVLSRSRRNIHRNALGRAAKRLRFALDVLLRE